MWGSRDVLNGVTWDVGEGSRDVLNGVTWDVGE